MPRCWTCGSEVPGAWLLTCPKCESIKRGFQDVHEIARTSSASVERLTKIGGLLEEQRDAVQNLAPELHGIASAIEWGFFERSWLLEQQTNVLQEISRKISQPSQIQATEWRKMAEALRARGVYNQAEDFFSKALEANPLDYQAYIGAGSTYLYLSQPRKAEKLFHEGIPHAPKGDSFDYGSYSLRLIARIKYCEPDIDQAISFVERAITLSPDYWKAYYDLAQYCAVAGDLSKSERALRTAIEADSRYFSMAESEQDFNPLEYVLMDIKRKARESAKHAIAEATEAIRIAEDKDAQTHASAELKKAKRSLHAAEAKVAKGTYEKYLEAKEEASQALLVADNATLVACSIRNEKAEKLKWLQEAESTSETKLRDELKRIGLAFKLALPESLFISLFLSFVIFLLMLEKFSPTSFLALEAATPGYAGYVVASLVAASFLLYIAGICCLWPKDRGIAGWMIFFALYWVVGLFEFPITLFLFSKARKKVRRRYAEELERRQQAIASLEKEI